MRAGERNDDVWKFILSNVRQPDHMAGDLHAQMASGEVGAQRLRALCDQHGLDDIEDLADEIIDRSRGGHAGRHPRAAGRHVPRRAPCSTSPTAAASTSSARSPSTPTPARSPSTTPARSDASPWGINVVKNYTHAYTTFTVRSVLNPEIPNNHGSLAPIKVDRPGGHDRQRRVAAAVHGPPRRRHVPAQRAAQGARPGPARAGDGRGLRRGVDDAGQRQPRRRHARSSRRCSPTPAASAPGPPSPGSSACSYPTGVAAVPIEVVEASAPIRFLAQGAARRLAAARGAQTGGLGQTIEFTVDTTRPWQLNAVTQPAGRAPPQGIFGGEAGRGRVVQVNGEPVTHAGPHHAAARRRRAPRPARRRRLRLPTTPPTGRIRHTDGRRAAAGSAAGG